MSKNSPVSSVLVSGYKRSGWRTRRLRQALVIAIVSAFCAILLLFGRYFERIDLALTNLLYVSSPTTNKIAIVAIDDTSLGAYGRSVADWSRKRHGELLDVLSKDGARVVAFDVLFAEPTPDDSAFDEAIQAAKQAGTRTVLAAVGKQNNGVQFVPGDVLHYEQILTPVTALQEAAMLGHVNVVPDSDSYVRWIPLALRAQDKTWVSLSVAAYLSYLRIPTEAISQVVQIGAGSGEITKQRIIPLDSFGRMLTNFFGQANTFPIYSYRAVHDGEIDPAVFRDKIVLVGMVNATGATDRYLVPIARGDPMSGVEIHANAIETLLQNRPLVPQSDVSKVLIIFVVSLLAGLVFSQVRWYWIFVLYAVLLIIAFVAASLLFSVARQVPSLFYPALALTLVMSGMLVLNIRWETYRRIQVQKLLDSTTRLFEQRLLLNDVAVRLGEEAERLLGCPYYVLWLWNEETEHLELSHRRLLVSAALGETLDSAAQKALLQKQLVVEGNAAVVPLEFQQRLVGVFAALQATSTARFSADQLELLELFAKRIAPTLAHARLYTAQLQQKDLLEAILSSTPDPVLVLNANQQMLRANPAASNMFAMANDVQAVPFAQLLMTIELPVDQVNELNTALSGTELIRQDVKIGPQDFVLLGAPLHATQTGWVLVLNDVSSLKELVMLKTQMLRMTSHDLKNPLGVIMGYSELLLNGNLEQRQRDFIEIIQTSSKRMLSIITDLLDLERLKVGGLEISSFELNAFIKAVVEEYEGQAKEKQQSLILHTLEDNLTIQADARQLHEAFSNLVGNAIKYTPKEGNITVSVSREAKKIHVSVADSGYGIAKAAQTKLFQPFYRVKTRVTSSIPGTGLGLSLAKVVIESHKGKLWVESEEGQGSTFHVELPVITSL